MSTRIVALTDDAFVILEEAMKRAGLTMGIPKTSRPIAYDRVSRELVVEDPHYDRDEGRNVVGGRQGQGAGRAQGCAVGALSEPSPEPPEAPVLSGAMHLDHPVEQCAELACPPEHDEPEMAGQGEPTAPEDAPPAA